MILIDVVIPEVVKLARSSARGKTAKGLCAQNFADFA